MEVFTAAIVLAIIVEGTLTYLFGESSEESTRPWLRYVSLGFGVVAAIAFQVDVIAALGVTSVYPLVGQIATGLVIGRGSNYVNDLISKMRE